MLLLAVTLLLAISIAGCKPVTAPGTTYTDPQGAFALILPSDFVAVPAVAGGPAAVTGTAVSFTAFRNPKTGERIAVGFIPLTGIADADVTLLMFGLSALPVGDDWQGVALAAASGAPLGRAAL